MLYIGFRIGIYYQTISWIDKWLKLFLEEIDNDCIQIRQNGNSERFKIILKDGTLIKAVQANYASRGESFDKVYIEPTISEKLINEVIRPTAKIPNVIIEDS